MEDKKKRVAAVSAVLEYIQKEEDQYRSRPSVDTSRVENLWGISGRQAQMQLRNMMQLKAFHGWKGR